MRKNVWLGVLSSWSDQVTARTFRTRRILLLFQSFENITVVGTSDLHCLLLTHLPSKKKSVVAHFSHTQVPTFRFWIATLPQKQAQFEFHLRLSIDWAFACPSTYR